MKIKTMQLDSARNVNFFVFEGGIINHTIVCAGTTSGDAAVPPGIGGGFDYGVFEYTLVAIRPNDSNYGIMFPAAPAPPGRIRIIADGPSGKSITVYFTSPVLNDGSTSLVIDCGKIVTFVQTGNGLATDM